MAETSLVESDRKVGRAVLKALDDSGIHVRTALWAWDDDANQWILVLALGLVDDAGELETHARIFREMRDRDVRLDPSRIRLIGLRDPIRLTVKRLVQTGPRDVTPEHDLHTGSPPSDLIEGAVVYRST